MSNIDYDIMDFNVDDFLNMLVPDENTSNDRDFSDIVNLESCLNREVCLGDIEEGVGSAIVAYINFWNRYDDEHNIPIEERKPIKLYVHSYGGSLIETMMMIDAIKLSRTPVIGIAQGAVYSGGFFTFITCHKRIAYPHASFLYHEGATANGGTAAQFENYTSFYRKQLNQLRDIVLEHTNITAEEYETIKKDDVWYLADEAIEAGIVDEITKEII